MAKFRIFSFLSDSFLKEKKERNKWTLSVFGSPEYDFNKIELKYYEILSNHNHSPTFDESPESTWNSEIERKLSNYNSKYYTDDKIISVPNCIKLLTRYQKLKMKYQKIVFNEMKEFAVEMVDRGMDPLDVLFLCSIDTSWARLYHIFSYYYFRRYSPRAHFISLMVQRVELFNLYLEKLRIEFSAAMYYKYNPAEEVFKNTIIQKRMLISQDSYFYKRLKEELPQLPISWWISRTDIDEVINRIMRAAPTLEATKMEKQFLEEIRIAMDEPIQKLMNEKLKMREAEKKIMKELLQRDKEYWDKIDREADLRCQKLLQEEKKKMMDKLEEKEELDQLEEELDQPEEKLDQPEEKEELDQPDKELDLDKQIKQQKKKPLKQKKKNSKKDKNS